MYIQRTLVVIAVLAVTAAGFNHPEIRWKSVTTDHFIINFYDRTEPLVYAAWKISEQAYDALSRLFDYELRDKIALSLAEYDDFSNGFSEWTAANIMVWIPDSRFELRSNTTWLRNVITHELAHIVSLEQKKRMQMIGMAVGATISTPDEEYGIIEPYARISTCPSWLAEGIAQFETENLGNDCWNSRREMVLRSAVLSNTMLSLDEMAVFNHDAFGSELLYNQGYAFTKYIAVKTGHKKLRALFRDASASRVDFMSSLQERTGISLRELYNAWADSLRVTFAARFPTRTENHRMVYGNGRFNLRPAVSPDGRYSAWFSSGPDDGGRTDLIVSRRGEDRPLFKVPYAHTALCFSPSSDRIYFVKSREPNKKGSYLNDLYSLSLADGSKRRLTRDGRIYDVAAPDGGGGLLCICYRNGSFGLYRLSPENGELRPLLSGELGAPLVNISVNPENPQIAVVSKIVEGRSRLFIWSQTDATLEPLSPGVAQEESPFWAPNGRIYFSADYDGVFNIYSLLPDGSDLKRHTETAGGYFSPHAGPEGQIIASHFSAGRFSIVSIPPSEATSFSVPDSYRCTFAPLPAPKGVLTIKSHPYQPKLRRGTWELLLVGQAKKNSSILTGQQKADIDTTGFMFASGLINYKSDALQKRQRIGQVLLGVQMQVGEAVSPFYGVRRSDEVPELFHPSPQRSAIDRYAATKGSRQPLPFYPHAFSGPVIFKRHQLRQSGSEQTDTAVIRPPFTFAAEPGIAFQNSCLAPTIGIELSANLQSMILPAFLYASPYMEFQITREWFCAVRADIGSMPFFDLPFLCRIPLQLAWYHPGYHNEDFSYNLADYSQMQLTGGPQYVPGLVVSDVNNTIDTTVSAVFGWMAGIELFRSIPLFKYGAMQAHSLTAATYHGERTLDERLNSSEGGGGPLLHGASNSYLLFANGIRAVFPIVRTINRGSRNYFDAWYGRAGYSLFCYANSSLFDGSPIDPLRLLAEKSYRSDSVYLDHIIFIGSELGRYKSHLFFTSLGFEVSYRILRSKFKVSLTAGF